MESGPRIRCTCLVAAALALVSAITVSGAAASEPAAWGFDTTGDGWADVYPVDVSGDGVADRLDLDRNQNLVTDGWAYDSDQSGVVEAIVLDLNENGVMDVDFHDTDQDGVFDWLLVDSNENGIHDGNEAVVMPDVTRRAIEHVSVMTGLGLYGYITNHSPNAMGPIIID